jgi:hypothetical protein
MHASTSRRGTDPSLKSLEQQRDAAVNHQCPLEAETLARLIYCRKEATTEQKLDAFQAILASKPTAGNIVPQCLGYIMDLGDATDTRKAIDTIRAQQCNDDTARLHGLAIGALAEIAGTTAADLRVLADNMPHQYRELSEQIVYMLRTLSIEKFDALISTNEENVSAGYPRSAKLSNFLATEREKAFAIRASRVNGLQPTDLGAQRR